MSITAGKAVAMGLAANLVAGVGLIKADEWSGTAHLSPRQIAAYRPLPTPPAAHLDMALATPAAKPTVGLNLAPYQTPVLATPEPTDRRFVIKRILPVSGPIKYGQWHWDETAVPAGPLVITVDLHARVISAFRNGYEIGTAAVLLGTDDKPTPLGVFPITQKKTRHVSTLYDAPMPYMMRLTGDGVAIHASNVQNGYASHGCIGVPLAFAKKLFDRAQLGDKVYITNGKRVGLGDSLVDQ